MYCPDWEDFFVPGFLIMH